MFLSAGPQGISASFDASGNDVVEARDSGDGTYTWSSLTSPVAEVVTVTARLDLPGDTDPTATTEVAFVTTAPEALTFSGTQGDLTFTAGTAITPVTLPGAPMRRNRGNFPAAWPSSGTMVECLASFVRVGHRTVLHAFDEIEDVPQGVESFDASRLMAADEIIRHRRTSSLALASDIHRHRILRENLGLHVDHDVPCLN